MHATKSLKQKIFLFQRNGGSCYKLRHLYMCIQREVHDAGLGYFHEIIEIYMSETSLHADAAFNKSKPRKLSDLPARCVFFFTHSCFLW